MSVYIAINYFSEKNVTTFFSWILRFVSKYLLILLLPLLCQSLYLLFFFSTDYKQLTLKNNNNVSSYVP